MGQFLIASHVLMRFKDFCLASLRIYLQTVKPLSISIELAFQEQDAPSSLLHSSGPFCFSDTLWDRGHTELKPLAALAFTVYVSHKLSDSVSLAQTFPESHGMSLIYYSGTEIPWVLAVADASLTNDLTRKGS